VQYGSDENSYIAGFAPVASLGWVAVASFPRASVVAGVEAGREDAFGILVLAAAVSAIIGGLVAERFVRPLSALGTAAEWLAVEEMPLAIPLPHSSFAEVQRLATIFGRMRERLATRTAERERALLAARAAARSREEFVALAAHELKTPVTALRGQTQLLMLRLQDNEAIDSQRLAQSLRRIDAQSHKLSRLVEQLLDAAYLERNSLQLVQERVDVGGLIQDVVAAHPYGKRIVTQLPDGEQNAHLDAARIEQVLNNLIDNAFKFSPDGGEVAVSLEQFSESRLRITVTDHGVGIPPEYRALIFERFHRAHAASHQSGLGLGLHITRQIVELHGGAIAAEFPTAGGTRFIVDLPLMRAAATILA
jgi:signal transduction histidine kinase